MVEAENSALLKQLASSDPETRDEAFASLRTYLTRSQPFSTLDCLKLHKYLFYAVYMSDGPQAQQQLCTDLASLIHALPGTVASGPTLAKPNVLPFLDAFWQTMAREWGGIDRLRLEKYLLLVRLVLRATFTLLISQRHTAQAGDDDHAEVDLELFESHMELVSRYPLSAAEKAQVLSADAGGKTADLQIPRGLTYHVLDCWVDEIERAAGGEEACQQLQDDDVDVAVIPLLVATVNGLEANCREKAVRQRAVEVLRDERLTRLLGEWPGDEDDEDEQDEEEEWDGMED